MTSHPPELIDLRRRLRASEWVVRLAEPDCAEREVDEWLAWCDEDPQNLPAFECAQRDWLSMDALRITRTQPHAVHKPLWLKMAAAAAIVLALGLILSRSLWQRASSLAPIASVQTERSNRSATLPDGSTLVLGGATALRIDFSGATRGLALDRGAAYFEVRHDRSRPFVVSAGQINVTAVGTAFDVRRENARIVVTVEEGAVDVERPGAEVWRVSAGERLSYSVAHRHASVVPVSPGTANWWSGQLAYIAEPLGTVIADVNRYSDHRIVLLDARLANRPYTGTVFTQSIDAWLQALIESYELQEERTADGQVLLRPVP